MLKCIIRILFESALEIMLITQEIWMMKMDMFFLSEERQEGLG